MHLKDGSPLTLEIFAPREIISPWLPAALAVQLCIIAFFVWLAVKLATQPLARLEHAANSLGSDLRGEPLPEDGPKEVARAATALNAMQRRIAEQVAERIQILAAISHDLQTPITRMRLRADFLGDSDAKEKLQGDLQEMQTLVKQGLALAREYDGIGPPATAHVAVEAVAGAVMSARFRRMAARLWPDSLFRRLAIILFAGLLAAHVLSFGLVALNVFGPSDELSDDYFMRSVATAVAILDRVKPEERPAWLDRLAQTTYRYVLGGGGEVYEPLKRSRGSVYGGP